MSQAAAYPLLIITDIDQVMVHVPKEVSLIVQLRTKRIEGGLVCNRLGNSKAVEELECLRSFDSLGRFERAEALDSLSPLRIF